MPTLAELCDVPLPDVPLDGRSLMPVVESAAAPSAHPVIHWQVGDGPNAEWAVREGDWKLIGKSRDTSKGGAGVTQERIQMLLVNIAKDRSASSARFGDWWLFSTFNIRKGSRSKPAAVRATVQPTKVKARQAQSVRRIAMNMREK